MIKPENKNKMVRGYVVAGSKHGGSKVEKDSPECITAYTHWYRHDDNLQLLERETQKLADLYMSFSKTDTVMFGYEYKDYRR